MEAKYNFLGKVILGQTQEDIQRSYAEYIALPVDQEMSDKNDGFSAFQTTLGKSFSVTGSGTFLGKAQRTLTFMPCNEPGWWFDRTDLSNMMPIGVSVKNVWTTQRNIVLCSGSPHNYMRMVEHIVALKLGLGLDNVMIKVDSGDPPLFDRSSLGMVEEVEQAGIVPTGKPAVYVTVKEPVTAIGPYGSFVTLLPAENGDKSLFVDCAVNFKTAIGKQRIRFYNGQKSFRHGSFARTNTSLWTMLYVKTIGRILADVRHLGYTMKNILVAGPRRYINKPGLVHNGKSLEAGWHRATLDLLAAIALIDTGRFCGTILSYKAGHSLDVDLVRELYKRDLLEQVEACSALPRRGL